MLGVNLRNYKLMAFAIGSGFAGVAGGLIGPLLGYIDPTMFSLAFSFQFLLMVVVGGAGRFEGAILGAMIVAILPEALGFRKSSIPSSLRWQRCSSWFLCRRAASSFVDWIYTKVTGKEELQLTK